MNEKILTNAVENALVELDKPLVARDERGRILPGQPSINPHGRPKKNWTMTELTEDALEESDETGVPFKKVITQKLRSLAVRGDIQAIKEIYDRMDGKSKDSLDLQVQGGFSVTLKRGND